MFTIDITKKDLLLEYPEMKKWIKKLNKLTLSNEVIDKSTIEYYYSYGFFRPKLKDGDLGVDTSNMIYEERLQFEFNKVRVNVSIEIGKFILSDRLPKGTLPDVIKKIVTEITKVRMIIEFEFNKNKEVFNSIPDLDKECIDIEIIREIDIESTILDIDSILDKITNKGYNSLSIEEIKYLDDKSKGDI